SSGWLCWSVRFLPRVEILEDRSLPSGLGDFDQLPLSFEVNQGQTDGQVHYLARGNGYTLYLTDSGATLSLRQADTAAVLQLQLVGGNPAPAVLGLEQQQGH